jgi:hypothetical protein
MAAARKPRDPKRQWTEGRHRLLTIHDGTRLTPTLVSMLNVLAEAADEQAAELTPDDRPNSYQRQRKLDELAPRIVARADGLALYVEDRRLG